MPTPERMNKRKGAQDMKKLMEILGDKRELCRLLNEHKDMLKKAGIVVLVIVLGLVVSAVKSGGQEEAQAQETTVVAEETADDRGRRSDGPDRGVRRGAVAAQARRCAASRSAGGL